MDEGIRGIQVTEIAPNIFMLLYADDIVMCGDTVGEIKKNVECLE